MTKLYKRSDFGSWVASLPPEELSKYISDADLEKLTPKNLNILDQQITKVAGGNEKMSNLLNRIVFIIDALKVRKITIP